MSIYDLGEMANRRRKAMERQKKPPTGSAEALVHCMENASAVQPIELSRSFAYIKSQSVKDDPIEWLVKEFGVADYQLAEQAEVTGRAPDGSVYRKIIPIVWMCPKDRPCISLQMLGEDGLPD